MAGTSSRSAGAWSAPPTWPKLILALFGEPLEREASESGRLLFALEVADSILTYRSRYLFAPMLPLVLDLLLVDETNPRSLGYPARQHLQPSRRSAAINAGREP